MDMRKLAMEAIGTFFLVLAVTTGGNPLAIGVTLMIMVYIGGNISGGHYNPAVSLAVFLRGKLPAGDLVSYILAQCSGGLAAALIGFLIMHKAPVIEVAAGATGTVASQYGNLPGAMVGEFLYTFMLALVVLTMATTKKNANNPFYGFCIGGTIVVAAFSVGGVTGGAFNPAVGLSQSIVGLFNKPAAFQWFWVYIVFPFLGGICAALAFKFLHPDEVEGPMPSLSSAVAAAKAGIPAPAAPAGDVPPPPQA